VNGPSITGAQAESASSAGTKFSFGVFIVAMLAKVPLGLAAAKMHMQLKEGGGAGGGAGAQAGGGAVMSPAHGKEGGGVLGLRSNTWQVSWRGLGGAKLGHQCDRRHQRNRAHVVRPST
jgi:hypothetical protein